MVSNTTAGGRYRAAISCDLLENFYLCGIKHNHRMLTVIGRQVVICLKISIFVVSNTTDEVNAMVTAGL